jgi:exopolysaccharide biosynthesis polyprenyl glycosylphosphotransferase
MQIKCIVVTSKNRDEHFPAEVLLEGKVRGRSIESGVAFYERLTGRIYLRDLRPSYLIFSDGFQLGPIAAGFKRCLDFSGAMLGLLLSAPLFCLCAIAIRLDSKGPILYPQERLGQDGRPFRLWKLRSMKRDAEAGSGPTFASEYDDRITRVGRFLRKTRLDELPQLLNVIRGDMSLVGPRPERPEFVEELNAKYPYFKLRIALKPGITGWAQIRGGYVGDVEGFEEKLSLDLFYMKRRSVAMDLLILWQTVKTVTLLRGV